MRSAAELEESMDKNAVTPGAIVPAREMLAELLYENGKWAESLTEYEAVLKVAPNRFAALFQAMLAASMTGQKDTARTYAERLKAVSQNQ